MSTNDEANAERRCRVVITEQELLCKKQCGFYGTPQWNGLCSQCWREHQHEQKRKQDFNKNRSLLSQEDRRSSGGRGEFPPLDHPQIAVRLLAALGYPPQLRKLPRRWSTTSLDRRARTASLRTSSCTSTSSRRFPQTIAREIERLCNALLDKLVKHKLASMDDLSMIVQDFYTALPERLAKSTSKLPTYSSTALLEHVENFVCIRAYGVLFCTRSDEEVMDLSLQERIRSLHWVKDLLYDAITEIVDMNSHKLISEKFDCLMRCSAKIFEALRESTKAPASADEFLPVLIYVILKSNPPLMQSNLSFIHRFSLTFRTCRGETGYHFTNLCCAIRFIQDMNAHSLRMPKEEFEAYTSGAKAAPTRIRSHVNAIKSLENSSKALDSLSDVQSQLNEQVDKLAVSMDERLNKLSLEVEKLENTPPFELPEAKKTAGESSEDLKLECSDDSPRSNGEEKTDA
ncbi:hypothetical protein M3Y99_00494900 [Aphelenchoides fujianensis]|nr:hypothetical protein M3Y99_00494900 [Aphelenchoides fujianensis]